jgi:hypothetical protein
MLSAPIEGAGVSLRAIYAICRVPLHDGNEEHPQNRESFFIPFVLVRFTIVLLQRGQVGGVSNLGSSSFGSSDSDFL